MAGSGRLGVALWTMRSPGRLGVAALLLGSGCCALIYQTVWLREFRLVFGASTAASAAVLAVFMAGLGIGGWVLGRRADRCAEPLRFYAGLEFLIAVSAALSPFLVGWIREGYLRSGGNAVLGTWGAAVVRLALAGLVLAVPTVAMGGTLPAAARAATGSTDRDRTTLALLYGSNTLGAVAGVLLATLILLEHLGNRGSLWLACVVNGMIALAAFWMTRGRRAQAAAASIPDAPARVAEEAALAGWAGRRRFVLGAAGVSGFAFLLMELVWYRMLSPVLGGSVFTFGLILAVALLGVGLGGMLYRVWHPEGWVSMAGLAATFGLEAVALLVPFALGDRVALLALDLRGLGEMGFGPRVLGWSGVAALVVLPASLVAGFQFPLMIALLGEADRRMGSDVGLAYAWNTLGAIAGSLAGGFGLMPLLTAPGTWRAVGLLLAAASVGAWGLAGREAGIERAGTRTRRWIGVGLALAAIVLLCFDGPGAVWRDSGIGAGRADAVRELGPNPLRDQIQLWRRMVQWEAEGVESHVALIADKGLSFLINGKSDGSARSDAGTVILGGLVGAWLHPRPERALVIGLGTGCTAGWLGRVPSIERVDAVELEPAVLRVASACEWVNADVLGNPKVRVHLGDGREFLGVSTDRYDVIFSEPSNPYRAGVASLFTTEFYRAAAERLTEDGLFLQWMQAYEVDLPTVQTACVTLADVFPVVETWSTQAGDLLFVAAGRPLTWDAAALRERLQQEPFRTVAARVWRVTDLEGMLARRLSPASVARAMAAVPGVERNTDDRTILEFRFARTAGTGLPFDVRQWLVQGDAAADARVSFSGGAVDWGAVVDRRFSMWANEGLAPSLAADADAGLRQRALAKQRYGGSDLAGALEAWRGQTQEPADLLELGLLAEGLAEAGDAGATEAIERLRVWQPVEAEVIAGRLAWRQGRLDEAVRSLVTAFERYRQDPWPEPLVMYRAMEMAQTLSREARQPELARRLEAALSKPFAVRLWDQARLACRFNVALDTLDPSTLLAAIESFEPHVPWRRFFLERRVACYEHHRDARLDRARRDLAAFDAKSE